MTARALDGLRVLDLSRVLAGPYCTQMLSDHGAEVIKVEPPGGDETRGWGPPFAVDGTSAYFTNLNRNKKNIVLDLAADAGRDILARLLGDADVLVENFKAGTLAKWGFPDEVVRARWPRLIHCRITGFGTEGPLGGLPGYDAVLQAYGGLMYVSGEAEGPPVRVGVPLVDSVTGLFAFSGILLALRERETSGLGQLVDCALLDTAISLLHPHSASWLATGVVPPRAGSAHPSIAPYQNFETRDGPLFIGAGNDRQFAALVDVLGAPELAEDPRFVTNTDRVHHADELRGVLGARIACWAGEELGTRLLARGVPAAPVHTVAEAMDSPQARHREMIVELDGYRGVGIPVKLGRTPGRATSPPHAAGEDTREVLTSAGYRETEIDDALRAGTVRASGSPTS
ncbi:CaiB/BaiF CoA transferase family protein [Amycolatopsis samaneae]|uniref:CaiB/BaiF CoA transferase family protein n=1 Tax=Amycolatopsis samaneae TaxID=664691 RepID=A0ABW5GPY9_9PSEU